MCTELETPKTIIISVAKSGLFYVVFVSGSARCLTFEAVQQRVAGVHTARFWLRSGKGYIITDNHVYARGKMAEMSSGLSNSSVTSASLT